MKIICAPDSYKQSLPASSVGQAMAAGIAEVDSSIAIDICPVGDGGEGTMDAMLSAVGGSTRRHLVHGPIDQPIEATFGVTDTGIGLVELAQASGLTILADHQRDPTRTTTYGTGELIQAAIEYGCRSVIVFLGGSATCDGAAGLAQALGVQFLDASGNLITTPLTGGLLHTIARIESPATMPDIVAACDVTNPLLGENGAAAVYGPQKGATPQQVRELDAVLAHLASMTAVQSDFSGAGAAGGAGFGLVALCGATLERGIDLVLNSIDFERRCSDADLVLTGEGKLDKQSLAGKAPIGVARAAQRLNVPTIAIVGDTGPGFEHCLVDSDPPGPLSEVHSLAQRFGLERSMRDTESAIQLLTSEALRDWLKRSHGS